jgi:hypothetical protein
MIYTLWTNLEGVMEETKELMAKESVTLWGVWEVFFINLEEFLGCSVKSTIVNQGLYSNQPYYFEYFVSGTSHLLYSTNFASYVQVSICVHSLGVLNDCGRQNWPQRFSITADRLMPFMVHFLGTHSQISHSLLFFYHVK